MGYTVRDKYIWQQFADEKHAGLGNMIPGQAHFVYPGTSATHLAYITDRHKKVYPTAALALADCVAGRGDAIVFAPGDHTVSTASLAMSKAGVMLFGPEAWMGKDYPGLKSSATLTTDIAGDEIMNITATDVEIHGLTFIPITQSDALDFSTAADRLLIKNCFFDLYTPAVHTSTIGITGAAADHVMIDGCVFASDGAQGNAIVATGLIDSVIQNCRLFNTTGTWASAVLCGAATTGLWLINNLFDSYGTALTVGVNGTGATIANGVKCLNNRFGSLVTVGIDNFDAGECAISENYDFGVGAADGGVLITAIT
jgi:hypothetical protein